MECLPSLESLAKQPVPWAVMMASPIIACVVFIVLASFQHVAARARRWWRGAQRKRTIHQQSMHQFGADNQSLPADPNPRSRCKSLTLTDALQLQSLERRYSAGHLRDQVIGAMNLFFVCVYQALAEMIFDSPSTVWTCIMEDVC